MRGVDLTRAAEEDLIGLWRYPYETWGLEQADRYFDRIKSCCEAIGAGEARSKPVDGLPDRIRVHRCERHYIFYLAGARPVVLAILHGRMDFLRRLKDRL